MEKRELKPLEKLRLDLVAKMLWNLNYKGVYSERLPGKKLTTVLQEARILHGAPFNLGINRRRDGRRSWTLDEIIAAINGRIDTIKRMKEPNVPEPTYDDIFRNC